MKAIVILLAMLLIPSSVAADSASDQLLSIMRCACDEGGERVFSDKKSLLDCECALGQSMRARIQAFMALQSAADKESKDAQLSFLENLMTEDPANERYITYPKHRHNSLMKNTLCSCGCGKMALSQCPLDCPWSPVYQRRFKFLLGLGFDDAGALGNYLKHANKVHRQGKTPLTMDDIILNQDKPLSWLFPVIVGVLAVFIFAGIVIRRSNRRLAALRQDSEAGEPAISALDREMLSDELDDIGG
ncbi:MAG TPA: hypothetical protein EYN06_00720 [Myxococcales bacterium]|nr:hypothetical protein [Myxococcales bacterium]HIN84971.1 hypothetical protein [Myxococcales bacterium]